MSAGSLGVTLFGRPSVVEPVERNGITIRRPDGSVVTARPAVSTSAGAPDGFDVVLLTVKAYSVADCLNQLESMLRPDGVVLAFQNGVGSDTLLLDRFGRDRIVAATSTVSVAIEREGQVTQYSSSGGLAYSRYGTGPHNPMPLLEASGLPVATPESPESLRWSKLLLNAVGSAQCAVLGINLDALARDRRLFRVEVEAFRERVDLMRAAGIRLTNLPGYRVRLAAAVMRMPPLVARLIIGRRMANGRGGKPPTLRSDVERGGPTESPYLHGSAVALGREVGVSTPVNEVLARLVDLVLASPSESERFRDNPNALVDVLRDAGIAL